MNAMSIWDAFGREKRFRFSIKSLESLPNTTKREMFQGESLRSHFVLVKKTLKTWFLYILVLVLKI